MRVQGYLYLQKIILKLFLAILVDGKVFDSFAAV